jgi:monoamine oxidase
MRNVDIAIVGAGAAGLGAAARLAGASASFVVVEARERIGGRAHTVSPRPDLPLDLGCAWLHSADRNVLAPVIEAFGFTIDRTPPHWERQSGDQDFPPADQAAFQAAFAAFEARIDAAAREGPDRPAADFLDPGGRWNPLIDAISSFYSGVELDGVSIRDFAAYEDSGVNWRVREGYGAAIRALAPDPENVVLGCPVEVIRHDGPDVVLQTPRGDLHARAVVVAVPTPILAEGRLAFSPGLPDKVAAAAGLPLGLANKVVLRIEGYDELPVEGHLFGAVREVGAPSFHLRPFGRPLIEAFIGGRMADALELEGEGAATSASIERLVDLLGSDVRRALTPLVETAWRTDPWSRGAYSHALPGRAGERAILAAPVAQRLFFAGEACSAHAYSTAHGAWETGVAAAQDALKALGL